MFLLSAGGGCDAPEAVERTAPEVEADAEAETGGEPAEPSQAELDTKGSPDEPPEIEEGLRDELSPLDRRPTGEAAAGGTGGPSGSPGALPPEGAEVKSRGANAPLEMPEGAAVPSFGEAPPNGGTPTPTPAPPG